MANPAWYLEGLEDNCRKVLRVALTSFPFSVGRTEDCDLPLNSLRISQRHAEFYTKDKNLWLRDHDSTNGTFVNGNRLMDERCLRSGDIVHFADLEFRVGQRRLESRATMYAETLPITKDDLDGGKYREFRQMLAMKNVQVLLQPIVNLRNASLLGHESLGQGMLDDNQVAAPDLFTMAETLGLATDLSCLLRTQGAAAANALSKQSLIFVNTHPQELNEQDNLLTSLTTLRHQYPTQPIVLEVHESAVTDLGELQLLQERLVDLDMEVAFDDFGVGQARLIDLSDAAPRYLKFDASLIHNLHRASKKRRDLVKTLVQMTADMNIVPIAEGIEKESEAGICTELGFEYGQGYYFGRPLPVEKLVGA